MKNDLVNELVKHSVGSNREAALLAQYEKLGKPKLSVPAIGLDKTRSEQAFIYTTQLHLMGIEKLRSRYRYFEENQSQPNIPQFLKSYPIVGEENLNARLCAAKEGIRSFLEDTLIPKTIGLLDAHESYPYFLGKTPGVSESEILGFEYIANEPCVAKTLDAKEDPTLLLLPDSFYAKKNETFLDSLCDVLSSRRRSRNTALTVPLLGYAPED